LVTTVEVQALRKVYRTKTIDKDTSDWCSGKMTDYWGKNSRHSQYCYLLQKFTRSQGA